MTNMWKEVQPTDEYHVQLNGMLHESDREVLQFLYQPLVGAFSTSLYSMLWGEVERHQLESEPSIHSSLMGTLSTDIDQLFEARIRLEGMGLLKTYTKGVEKRRFIYQLQPPLHPNEFFEDPMLSVFLYRQVGNTQFLRLKKRFIVHYEELLSFREVTRTFQDVFSSEALTQATPISNSGVRDNEKLLFETKNAGLQTDLANFDFNLLLAGLSEMMVPRKALTYHVKNMIAKLSTLYGLSVLDMKNIVITAVSEDNEIDIELLRKAARDYYQLHRNQTLPKLESVSEKNKDEIDIPNDNAGEEELVYYLENASPVQVLKDASTNNAEPTKAELSMIEELLYTQKLPTGVVNVLIQFVLIRTDMKLTKSYVEKIASHWARKDIKTVKSAMELAKMEHKQYMEWKEETNNGTKKRKSNKTVRKEKLPDWFKDRQKSEDEEPSSSQVKGKTDLEFEERKRKFLEKRRQKKLEAGE